ncbi:MAG: lysine--tRNA ligase, partial [Gammaproteobacteria bacterium]|nr:lysine--tRNA ligase [Gammaproteobacteria bacterium]
MRETEGNTEHKLIAERRGKLDLLRKQGLAFPNDFNPKHYALEVVTGCAELDAEALAKEEKWESVRMAGRVIRMRGPFIVIDDGSGVTMQVYINFRKLTQAQTEQIKLLDLGDIIGVEGGLFYT